MENLVTWPKLILNKDHLVETFLGRRFITATYCRFLSLVIRVLCLKIFVTRLDTDQKIKKHVCQQMCDNLNLQLLIVLGVTQILDNLSDNLKYMESVCPPVKQKTLNSTTILGYRIRPHVTWRGTRDVTLEGLLRPFVIKSL